MASLPNEKDADTELELRVGEVEVVNDARDLGRRDGVSVFAISTQSRQVSATDLSR